MNVRTLRPLLAALALGAVVASGACLSTSSLFATDLDVQPDTAQAGDTVAFVFYLQAIPSQTITVKALVDGTEMVTLESAGLFDGMYSVDVGDAADLIARFGTGTHGGQVEVRSLEEGRTVRTQVVEFLLQ